MMPLLSIVVPTKDRSEYLSHLVHLFASVADPRVELVIQDNSRKPSPLSHDSLGNGNVTYRHESGQLSVVANSERAVEESNGEYVCMLGDDDGFLSELPNWVAAIKRDGYEALVVEQAQYAWPDILQTHRRLTGAVTFKKFTNTLVPIDAPSEVARCLESGGTSLFRMPRVYHGVVSRRLLEEVRERSGSYFPGPSPDMANAVALSLFASRVAYLNRPVVISGKGAKSTGGRGLRHAHVGRIEDVAHLPMNTASEWDCRIPRVWTGPTIYAESVLKSLQRCGRADLLLRFNYLRHYAHFAGAHWDMRRVLTPLLRPEHYPRVAVYLAAFVLLRGQYLLRNLSAAWFGRSRHVERIPNVPDIASCARALEVRLSA